jgi:hypothetical protein
VYLRPTIKQWLAGNDVPLPKKPKPGAKKAVKKVTKKVVKKATKKVAKKVAR